MFTKSRHLSLPQPDQSSSHPSYFLKSHFNIISVGPLLPTHSTCRGLLLHLITLNDTHSVGLLWLRDRPIAETSTWQHNTHPCPRRNWNPQCQQATGPDLRLRPCWHRDRFHFNIILQRTPGHPSGLLPSGAPSKMLHAPLLSPIHVICPAHLILLIINIKNEITTLSDLCDRKVCFMGSTFNSQYFVRTVSCCDELPCTSTLYRSNLHITFSVTFCFGLTTAGSPPTSTVDKSTWPYLL
jgi:hypothetical protein